MRLSDERLAQFTDYCAMKGEYGPSFAELGALVAEVRALRECEKALEAARREHFSCEDSWYSCPQSLDGCSRDGCGEDCDCGASIVNDKIDAALAAVRALEDKP